MLFRKMLRDIKENKFAYIACIVVIAIGLITYTSMSMAKDNLYNARKQFYSEFNLADGFATVKSMPYEKIRDLQNIDGIDKVEGRLVKDVRIASEMTKENVYLRFISIDPNSGLNGVKLIKGSMPSTDQKSILVGYKYFDANKLSLGSKVTAVIDGKNVDITVDGAGQSPEFVYALKNGDNIMPDPKTFEIAYMQYNQMESLFGVNGEINDVSFTLKPGVKYKDIEQKVKDVLEKYRLDYITAQKDQISNYMLSQELVQLDKSAKSVPIIFLMISSIILYIMLKRLVEQQREQIGMMKAFGYTKKEILLHYILYGAFIGSLGGFLGGIFGTMLASSMTMIYQQYYSLPNLKGEFSPTYFFSGLVLSTLFSAFAAFIATRGVLRLRPVDAMRPPAPMFSKKTLFERLPFFDKVFNLQGMMAVRNLFRNRGRSISTGIGIVFTFSIMATLLSMNILSEMMIMDDAVKVKKYDVKIAFKEPQNRYLVVNSVFKQKGVNQAEALTEISLTLKNGYKKKDVVAIGLESNSQLYNLLRKDDTKVAVPEEGVVLSEQVAMKLGAEKGDIIEADCPIAKENPVKMIVVDIIPQYLGVSVYLNIDYLNHLIRQGDITTSVVAKMDKDQITKLKDELNDSKNIQSFENKLETVEKYREMMGSYGYTIWIMAILACVTGFAIVYNSSIISLAERKRELATLRVFGMSDGEVMQVVSTEQWVIGISGMIVGIPTTYMFMNSISKGMGSDLYTIPNIIEPSTLIQSCIGTIAFILFAQYWTSRKISKLQLVEVLKERE